MSQDNIILERNINDQDFFKIKKKLGLFFKIERIKLGLSILELSEISGITQSQISRIENGKVKQPTLKSYLLLCYSLNIDLFNFISEISEASPFNNMEQEKN